MGLSECELDFCVFVVLVLNLDFAILVVVYEGC